MTQTINKLYTILDREFDIDELEDIVNHGMSAGVSGFIDTHECCDAFDKYEDCIEEFLSDWYHDRLGENDYIKAIAGNAQSINALKTRMVWRFVELNAHDILVHINCCDFD